jgi:hypothetical protein
MDGSLPYVSTAREFSSRHGTGSTATGSCIYQELCPSHLQSDGDFPHTNDGSVSQSSNLCSRVYYRAVRRTITRTKLAKLLEREIV